MYAKEIITATHIVTFWDKAIERGAHLQTPQRTRPIKPECWERWLGVTWNYVYTDRTMREIGEEYDMSYEYVRKIADKTTKLTWKSCSRSLKRRYPLKNLSVRKIIASAY